MTQRHLLPVIFVGLAALGFSFDSSNELFAGPPYPTSKVITGVTFDFSTHRKLAPGSDNWPITWADDGHQYTCWGDGGGFGGTNSKGRVSLGFARVEGDADNYKGVNVWGGFGAPHSATFGGKSYGILSVDGVLYAWWGPGSGSTFCRETRVLKSTDHGKSWMKSDWRFTKQDELYGGTLCNFGRDYADARDEYVYSYFPRGTKWAINKPGKVDLARVHKTRIIDRDAYEFFAGFDGQGTPKWTVDVAARRAVFEDPNGVRTASVSFNRGLGRYLLTTEHTQPATGNLAIFDAPEPWGPWTTVAYYENWHNLKGTISFYFSSKWFSEDGKQFTMVFTDRDHWATVQGRFTVNE